MPDTPMTPEDLIAAYRTELERLHGQDYVAQVHLIYDRGWFRLKLPTMIAGVWHAGNPLYADSYRRTRLEALLEIMRQRRV